MTDNGFPGWRFDAKDNAGDGFRVVPRAVPDASASGLPLRSAFAAVAGLGILALVEGSLAWVALRWAHTLGWLSEAPGWSPVVGIAAAVTLLRGIDRSVFTRQ